MKKLNKKEGFKYTQNYDINLIDRFFVSEMYLASDNDIDKWKLISDEEVETLKNEIAKLREKDK